MKSWIELAKEMYQNQTTKDIGFIKKHLSELFNNKSITNKAVKDVIFNIDTTKENNHEIKLKDNIYRFGVVSDTHMSSKHFLQHRLNQVYEIFEKEQIDTVYHAGDLTEGYKMRLGHEFEITNFGSDEQVEDVIKNYPKIKGITTKYILGNHDLTHMKNGGTDIGKIISKERKDMVYLGPLNAKILISDKCKLEINHPLDGSSYALSYSIQKLIDSYSGGEKPQILLNGHHHKLFYTLYRNIHALECGTLEGQTAWMKGKRIQAHIGAIIVTIHLKDNGSIARFIPEFITFYDES